MLTKLGGGGGIDPVLQEECNGQQRGRESLTFQLYIIAPSLSWQSQWACGNDDDYQITPFP